VSEPACSERGPIKRGWHMGSVCMVVYRAVAHHVQRIRLTIAIESEYRDGNGYPQLMALCVFLLLGCGFVSYFIVMGLLVGQISYPTGLWVQV
jgi:hypothetical protein